MQCMGSRERDKGPGAKDLGSGACWMEIRVPALAWLCQGAAESATGQWAAWGWPACQPSAAGQPHRWLRPPPLFRWPHSSPVCHNPKQSAPPGLSVVVREKGEIGRRHGERHRGYHLSVTRLCRDIAAGVWGRETWQLERTKRYPGAFIPSKGKSSFLSFCFRKRLTVLCSGLAWYLLYRAVWP